MPFRHLANRTSAVAIQLYNTLTREKQAFEPLDPKRVTLYVCGPTVYNYAHIGNARPAVIFDLLRRVLERHYPEVAYARNITDVDDKINAAAAERGVPIEDITSRYTAAYLEDMAALGVRPPTLQPRATGHIEPMIRMIERLIESGHAYVAEGHVLFAIDSYDRYGALSRRDMREMVAGARVEVAPYKRHPGDFVLWKPSVKPQPGWDSPWGWGRPGWHLECSTMAESHLGETIDIHGGGQDLIFPHHENEIAQSVCSHGGKPFARYWMHNGFVTIEKRKMSKSLGNTLVVHELLKSWPGEVMRYLLLSAHYRQPLDWSDLELERARRTLDRLYGVLRTASDRFGPFEAAPQPGEGFLAALDDDLNTPVALAEFNRVARELAKAEDRQTARTLAAELLADAELIGLLQTPFDQWFSAGASDEEAARIDDLIAQRNAARADRDFATADRIRDELTDMGIVLEDRDGQTRWRRAEP
ncbi:cysteine--tRNA ligase [Elongatibacter sediminis]|uniref:Cysteine--tRNA ligase n=1 Tax=Elongatibacter sediminis TaxID=3119006 RepID=A0AAW9RAE6_9GAMM